MLKAFPDCCGGKLYSEFDIVNTTVDNDISAFNDEIYFIRFDFNNMLKTEEVIYQTGNLKGVVRNKYRVLRYHDVDGKANVKIISLF